MKKLISTVLLTSAFVVPVAFASNTHTANISDIQASFIWEDPSEKSGGGYTWEDPSERSGGGYTWEDPSDKSGGGVV